MLVFFGLMFCKLFFFHNAKLWLLLLPYCFKHLHLFVTPAHSFVFTLHRGRRRGEVGVNYSASAE